jgi:hypothetical protein
MFDPTAYENIKVILEGIVYDYDLSGQIKVIERNDLVNLADLSRNFNMSFIHKRDRKQLLTMTVELNADFKQLASEWVALAEEPGANFSIQYSLSNSLNEILEKRILKFFKQRPAIDFYFEAYKQIYLDQRTVQVYKFNKTHPITEKTLDEVQSIIEQTIITGKSIYQMLQH